MCEKGVLAVLAEPALALLTGYKLIADLGNQNKLAITSRSDYSRCRMRSGIYSHVIETQILCIKSEFKIENRR